VIVPVILAGGSGSRLWPLSREAYPKQLLQLLGEHSLLQATALRVQPFLKENPLLVIGNDTHRFLMAEQLQALTVSAHFLLEPSAKSTAPAVAACAWYSLKLKEDPVLLVLPADHYLSPPEDFLKAVDTMLPLATDQNLITFGIPPSRPETGYGYIKKGKNLQASVFQMDQFIEKPPLSQTQEYCNSGEYVWNTGIFMFKAKAYLSALKVFSPDIYRAMQEAVHYAEEDLGFVRLNKAAFNSSPNNSIDYAVMEKTQHGLLCELNCRWNDLGSWESLYEVEKRDANNNVAQGDVVMHDVKNSYLHSTHRLVTAIGLDNHLVIETSDAILVADRSRVQELKTLVQKLKTSQREEAKTHQRVYRPWGYYELLDEGNHFKVKRISVKAGAVLSLQSHQHRSEHWVVVSGMAEVTYGESTCLLEVNQSTYIPKGMKHRLKNPGKTSLEVIEVQSGDYLGEDDIQRYEDHYGRVEKEQVN